MKLQTNPIVALLVAALVPVISGWVMAPPNGWQDLPLAMLLAAIVYVYSVTTAVVLGLPAYALLYRLGWTRWWSASGTGLLVGAWVGYAVWKPYSSITRDVPAMALTGALTGLLFWSLLSQRNKPVDPEQAHSGH